MKLLYSGASAHSELLFFFLLPPAVDAQLDDVGFNFVKNSISAIENRGELQDFKGNLFGEVYWRTGSFSGVTWVQYLRLYTGGQTCSSL